MSEDVQEVAMTHRMRRSQQHGAGRRLLALAVLATLLLAAGCVPGADGPTPAAPEPTIRSMAEPTAPAEPTAAPAPTAGAESPIVGPTWQWLRFEGGDGTVIEVDDPTKYTIAFQADGTYTIIADCNQGSGSYTEEGGSLMIEEPVLTRVACPEGSLDGEFLRGLRDTRTYVLADGLLHMNLFADAGNMVFEPAE
jgi:heat shock protein HslJ